MISLRRLKKEDAPYMIEWMHDEDSKRFFQKDMSAVILADAQEFCSKSNAEISDIDGKSLHYAVVDNDDIYLGTISLKNISVMNQNAEYAISLRKCSRGKGVGKAATKLILAKAFDELGLSKVYLNVYSDNEAAINMYTQCGFIPEGRFVNHINRNGEFVDLLWFGIFKDNFVN